MSLRAPLILLLCSALALPALADARGRGQARSTKKRGDTQRMMSDPPPEPAAEERPTHSEEAPPSDAGVAKTAVEAAPPATPVAPTPAAERAAVDGAALHKLDGELAAVLDELVKARARAGVLAQALFRTSLEVAVMRASDDARLERVVLTLDGAPIHDSDGSALARDRAQLFQGFVAPGMHELGVELTERAKENPEFGYVRKERFRIDVKKKRDTRVELTLRDDSDMAEEAAQDDDGTYEVATELRVVYGKARD